MSWNYRVMHCVYDSTTHPSLYKNGDSEDDYGIVEAYYDDQDNVNSWTVNFMAPSGETLEELKANIEMMKEAFDKPILEERELLKKISEKSD